MQRRTFIAAGGLALAGLAGCLSDSDEPGTQTGDGETPTDTPDDGTPTDTPDGETPTPGDSPTPTPSYDGVEVTLEAVQPGLIELVSPDSVSATRAESQYVYVQVEAGDPAPPSSAFGLRFDGKQYPPANLDDFRLYREYGDTDIYSESSASGWLLFELPETGVADEAAVTWPGGETALSTTARAQLSSPDPTLSVELSAPESLPEGESPEIEITVTNEGDAPGQFTAGLNRVGPLVAYIPVARFSRRVPAGETVTIPVETDPLDSPGAEELDDGEADVRYLLRWVGGETEAKIRMTAD